MKYPKATLAFVALTSLVSLLGCSGEASNAPYLKTSLRISLDEAGLQDVTENQDTEKGVITLGGHVPNNSDKAHAESITKSMAVKNVVSNQIAVIPADQPDAERLEIATDKTIGENLTIALAQTKFEDVKFTVKNAVVTLTGDVDTKSQRAQAQKIAAGITSVSQVVNELQARTIARYFLQNEPATSSI
jgi:osmotically-inducible protein OsmY